jgi:hypothetical protein
MCVKLDGQVIPKDKVVIIMKFIQPRESHHIKLCLSSGQTGGKTYQWGTRLADGFYVSATTRLPQMSLA